MSMTCAQTHKLNIGDSGGFLKINHGLHIRGPKNEAEKLADYHGRSSKTDT